MRNRLLLPVFLLTAILAQAQAPTPLWETDLSKLGYQGRPPAPLLHLSLESLSTYGSWTYQQGVAFLDPDLVVVYFVVHDDPPVAKEPSLSDPFHLVAVFLNSANGALIKKLEWPLPRNPQQVPQSFFFPAADGRFIVVLGNTLNLYSAKFESVAHFDAPSEISPIASPSGNSLLLETTGGYQLLDTRNLSVLKSWTEPPTVPPHQVEALWDDTLTWTWKSSLYFKDPASAPKELLTNRGRLCGAWTFIGKQNLAGPVCGSANKILTVSSEGKTTGEFDLGFEQTDGPIVASTNGKRFAVPTMRWGQGTNNEPEQLAARVFGLTAEAPLLTLSVPRSHATGPNYFVGSYGDTRFGWGGLALSPDGALLAVKSAGIVQIYRVPQVATAAQVEPANPHPLVAQLAGAPSPSSQLVEQMLFWFPADTETVTAARGPFLMPQPSQDGTTTGEDSEEKVSNTFRQSPLLLLMPFARNFKDEPMVEAIEGSRAFAAPTGLGMMKYQGGVIAVFANDITARAQAFLKDSASTKVRNEQIEGHDVAVFEQKAEQDTWVIYVAFPKPNIAVAATNENYLREVLARINGKHGERALPDNLPEWKHVDTQAEFWALRHYQKTGMQTDPTSPFVRWLSGPPDREAIGLTFTFDPGKRKTATITFLSGNKNSLKSVETNLFRDTGPALTQLHVHYTDAEHGALEGSYDLQQFESASYFVFVLDALLGHAIYL